MKELKKTKNVKGSNWRSSEESSSVQYSSSSVAKRFPTQFVNIEHINIVPSSSEILSKEGLRLDRNIVTEPFPNVDVYLSIHFRLLFEDFMQPFRKAIASLKEEPAENSKEVRLYRNAKFVKSKGLLENLEYYVPDCESSWRCYEVTFKPPNHVDWQRSKRLIHGSLVCLWDKKDEFIIGITANNSPKDLSSGHLVVAIGTGDLSENFLDKTYVMIESVVFYEPYRAVLQALRQLTTEQFPLANYVLGHVMCRRPPSYLRNCSRTPYVVRDASNTRSYPVLHPLEPQSWPSAQQLGLDAKQHSALINALTSQVSLIQGPPGTGKTFLALQIVKVLLENASLWQPSFSTREEFSSRKSLLFRDVKFKPPLPWKDWNKKLWNIFGFVWRDPRSPILVVCLTNHALDQFLEGMLAWTDNIVRVGGQSKSDAINELNLKNVKENAMKISSTQEYTDSNYLYYLSKISYVRTTMKKRLKSIKREMEKLAIELPSLHDLKEKKVICPGAASWLEKNVKVKGDKPLKHWLRWDNHRQLKQVARELRIKLLNDIASGKEKEDIEDEEDCELTNYPDRMECIEDEGDCDDILADLSDDLFEDIPSSDDESFKTASSGSVELLSQKCDEQTQSFKKIFSEQILSQDEKELHDFAERQIDKIEDIRHFLCNLPPEENVQFLDTSNLASLSRAQAWQLFSHWRRCYRDEVRKSLEKMEQLYEDDIRKFNELKGQALAALCRGASVVGMTTTGAAKNRKMLEALRCKIVIVEEAAEVLESHVICSLTAHCQQLIMIGDHQQLRPSVNVQELEKDYHLGVSLFERLINVGLEPDLLNSQHRMRPEIARFITPSIYPDLKNAADVYGLPNVPGMLRNVYFYHHESPERQEENSFLNVHEAEMALGLAAYLCDLVGIAQEKVTILTTYSSQLRKLRGLLRSKWPWLQQLRITVVDNYQGEENDIVILSLVRSNSRSSIGFLATPNRVCVALSRAKHGFYMLGNMELLSKVSSLWSRHKSILCERRQIGTAFPLCCERHCDSLVMVTKREDYPQQPFCKAVCGFAMNCGHSCPLPCHEGDTHVTRCQQLVTVSLPCGHEKTTACVERDEQEVCSEPVGTSEPCGHWRLVFCYQRNFAPCSIDVDRSFPCGHKKKLPCSAPALEEECAVLVTVYLLCAHTKTVPCGLLSAHPNFKWESLCQEMVSKKLPCGHKKRLECRKDPADAECGNTVDKMLDCGHMGTFLCHGKSPDDLEAFFCKETVQVKLPCGHHKKGPCFNVHGPCQERVERLLACNHTAVVVCSEISPLCNFFLLKLLNCGHKKTLPCHQVIDSVVCDEMVKVQRPSCSHPISVPCHLRDDVNYLDSLDCETLVPTTLPCGHESSVLCGTSQADIKIARKFKASQLHRSPKCTAIVFITFPCGHVKEMKCYQEPESVFCFQEISNQLPCGHSMNKICGKFEEPLNNFKCDVKVSKLLPCGHHKDMPCYREDNVCVMVVKQTFDCGHSVNTPCTEVMTNTLCKSIVKKKLQCGHSAGVECWKREDEVECDIPCNHRLGCGHTVKTTCSVPFLKRLSLKCEEKQTRELPCGHQMEVTCGSLDAEKPIKQLYCRQQIQKVIAECGHKIICDCGMKPTRENCQSKCEKKLKCDHSCKLNCSDYCDPALCEKIIDLTPFRFSCGHPLEGPCYLRYSDETDIETWTDQARCPSACGETLDCGHLCTGKCFECRSEHSHAVCKYRCLRTLVCGHKCEAQCAVACPPCKKSCSYECIHGPCKNACCEDCSFCEEPCAWRCPHAKCDHQCGDLCNRKPCNKSCLKKLACGHRCIGLCGELCPEKCHNCSAIVIKDFNRTKKYVYLQCGHWVEVNEMDRWIFKRNENEEDVSGTKGVASSSIHYPCCPICGNAIVKCFRYGDVLKGFMDDLTSMKFAYVKDKPDNAEVILKALTSLVPEMEKFEMHAPLEEVLRDVGSMKSCNHNQRWDAVNRLSLTYEWSCLMLDVKRKYFGSFGGKKFELHLSDSDADQIVAIGLRNLKKISNVRNCGADFCLNLSDICSRLDLLRQILVIKTASSQFKLFLSRELKRAVAMAKNWFDFEDSDVEFLTEWFASVAKESKLKLTSSVKTGCELVQRFSMSEDVWKKCQKLNCGEVYCGTRFDSCEWC